MTVSYSRSVISCRDPLSASSLYGSGRPSVTSTRFPKLVTDLVDQQRHTEEFRDIRCHVKLPAVLAVKIQRNHRRLVPLNELGDKGVPGQFFDAPEAKQRKRG